ncbi:MAG: hypothetical protein FIA99_08920 [Ruminiclostridium sp.]|nr:hypothetical protein [Ruminiclostridium sp.]
MKLNFEIRDTYDDAADFASTCKKPIYILHGDEKNRYWIADLSRANRLIKQGYRIANKEAPPLEIIHKSPDKYGLQMAGKNCHRIVKILREYEDEKEAVNDVTRLLVGEITERELTASTEQVDDGRLGNRINVLEAALEGIRDNFIQAMGDNDRLEKVAREAVKRINDLVAGRKDKV